MIFCEDDDVDEASVIHLIFQVDYPQAFQGPKEVWRCDLAHTQLTVHWLHARQRIQKTPKAAELLKVQHREGQGAMSMLVQQHAGTLWDLHFRYR